MKDQVPGDESRPAVGRAARDPAYERELRARVLDELALVQGRIAVAATLDGSTAKEQLRLAHGGQRTQRLEDA
ncbi:MAG: hypothetical protein ABUL47_02425, partial [Leifsonia sp.]